MQNPISVSRKPALQAIALFAPTIFLSAWLLFLVQPLFAKMALPLLGGTPNVWNAALVFFQATLLLGYLYAHLLTRFVPMRLQVGIHAGVLALAFVVLPLGIGAAWQNPPAEAPTGWLFALFGVCVGLPFLAVSANAPLLQRWFARTGHRDAHDPYFLYGASNLGSMLALLAYPLLIEPLLPLQGQSWLWTGGYMLLAVLIVGCGLLTPGTLGRAKAATDSATSGTKSPARPISWRDRGWWIALAFVPSGLLLSVTSFITTDLVAIPLLWVVPLSLFLLTFVFVFARKPLIKHEWMVKVQAPFLIAAATITFLGSSGAALWQMGVVLASFFVLAMVCHGELAARRPAAVHLTEFYLWMSFGGILGGAFTALLAPLLFDTVLEFPLLLVLAALLRPKRQRRDPVNAFAGRLVRPQFLDVGLPAICILAALGLDPEFANISSAEAIATILLVALCGITLASGIDRPLRLALAVAALMVIGNQAIHWIKREDRIFAGRSFFGVYKVARTGDGSFTVLTHGTTIHGVQSTKPAVRRTPHTYYHAEAGIGRVFATAARRNLPVRDVGAVGLGAGEIACYRRPGQRWTFFEIDPMVVRIARDPAMFRYLADCAPKARMAVGDGRLSLSRMQGRNFDLLVLDAFSSDAIPLHLLTREAFAVYLERLRSDGLLMVHISNRYVDLKPVLAALAADAGLNGAVLRHAVGKDIIKSGFNASSEWVALARSPAALARFLDRDRTPTSQSVARWQPLEKWRGRKVWTDDYSNVLGVLTVLN